MRFPTSNIFQIAISTLLILIGVVMILRRRVMDIKECYRRKQPGFGEEQTREQTRASAVRGGVRHDRRHDAGRKHELQRHVLGQNPASAVVEMAASEIGQNPASDAVIKATKEVETAVNNLDDAIKKDANIRDMALNCFTKFENKNFFPNVPRDETSEVRKSFNDIDALVKCQKDDQCHGVVQEKRSHNQSYQLKRSTAEKNNYPIGANSPKTNLVSEGTTTWLRSCYDHLDLKK